MGKANGKKNERRESFDKKSISITSVYGSLYFSTFILIILSFVRYKRNAVWMGDLQLWNDVTKKSQSKARAHNDLGLAYYNQGRMDEAIKEFMIALRLKPNEAIIHNNLGLVYWNKGLEDMAREEFEIALKLRPDFLPAKQALESLSKRPQTQRQK